MHKEEWYAKIYGRLIPIQAGALAMRRTDRVDCLALKCVSVASTSLPLSYAHTQHYLLVSHFRFIFPYSFACSQRTAWIYSSDPAPPTPSNWRPTPAQQQQVLNAQPVWSVRAGGKCCSCRGSSCQGTCGCSAAGRACSVLCGCGGR